jgi:eukaryotic-like serine/threonine-protein kinase
MAGSPDQSGYEPGSLLAGKYRVERALGQGGMGTVVAARHEQLGQRVAVKFLLPALCEQEGVVARFVREARAAVQISSEHVARVIDVGKLENGAPYMVMEYLEGHDLSTEIDKHKKLPVSKAAEYVLQACEAVAEAHRLGIVHRDLKPGNLFLTHRADGSPLVKVLDFGISKLTADNSIEEANLTKTQTMLGSPLYASPEQLRDSRSVDHRTDIWALGAIFYELVTGDTPFTADTLTGLLATIITESHTPLSAHLDGPLPDGLEEVINHCLAKDRNDRYDDVGQLARALVPFAPRRARISAERVTRVLGSLDELPPSIAPPALAAATASLGPAKPGESTTGPVSSEAMTAGGSEPRRASRTVLWAGGAGAVALIGVVAFALHGHHGAAAAPAQSAAQPTIPAPAQPTATVAVTPVATAPAEPAVAAEPSASVVSTGPAPEAAAPHAKSKPREANPRPRVAFQPSSAARPKPKPAQPKAAQPKPAQPAFDPLAGRH